MKKLVLIVAMAVPAVANAEQLADGEAVTIVGIVKSTRGYGVANGRVAEIETFSLMPTQSDPRFPQGLTIKPAPVTGLTEFRDLPLIEVAADCVIRLKRSQQRPICELRAYEAAKTAPSVSYETRQRQESIESAEIKMRSFDRTTVGRTAYISAAPIDELIPRAAMVAILYRDTPCALPLSGAQDLRAAESLYGRGLVPACWGKLVTPTKDAVIIVTKFGDSRRESLLNYAETKIQPDGSAQFIRPAMSRDEFMKNVNEYHRALH